MRSILSRLSCRPASRRDTLCPTSCAIGFKAFLLMLCCLGVLSPTGAFAKLPPQPPGPPDFGFETGALDYWSAIGPASVIDTDFPYAGTYHAFIGGSDTPTGNLATIESSLGLASGILAGLHVGPGQYVSGAAIYQSFSGTAGDTFSFHYRGSINAQGPIPDGLFYSLTGGGMGGLADTNVIEWINSNFNAVGGELTLTLPTTGTYIIGFGVLNGATDTFTPKLYIDSVAPPILAATHWLGSNGTSWSAATWASDAGGTPTLATPTAADDITFTATGGVNQLGTRLDADFTINSLTVNSATGISTAATQTLTVNTTTTLNNELAVNRGVTLISNGILTTAVGGTLTGTGAIQMATNQNLFNNGAIKVGDPMTVPMPSTLSVTTSGTGSVVMGATSTLLIDLFSGATRGDNTGLPMSSDRLSLVGTLNATAGGSLVIGNPYTMKTFAGGDKWLLVNLNGGAGSITGTLGVNDTALNLTSTQVGNFNQSTGVYTVIDVKDGLSMACAQDQGVMAGVQGIISDINGRLFNLRAGWGEEPQGSISDSLNGGVNEGVIDGQGDGPENPIAKKVLRSRQWEVFSTVNYANISLNNIRSQPGVESQTWAPGVGIERHFNRNLTVGFAANLLETRQSYSSGLGSLDMQGVTLATYASWVQSAFWVDLLYSFGRFDLDSQRNSAGFPVANGDTAAYTNAVQLNGGLSFRVPAWKLVHGPLFGVDWLHVNVDGYSETGGGIGALSYASRSMDSLITRIGWSVSRDFDTDFAKITPQVRLVYERQNITNNNGTSVNLINQPFTANAGAAGEAPGQSYMVAGAGVNFQFTQDLSMLVTYQGQFLRQDMQAHYGGVRFSYKF